MRLPKDSKKRYTAIDDLYAIKIGSIWREVWQQHVSFWAITGYFFFEYVRPQSIYPVIDVLPWAQITIIVALMASFVDRSVRWVASIENKHFIIFLTILILSSVFAFDSQESWSRIEVIINWVLVYFLVINIVNTEKRLFIFLLGYLLFNFKMSQHGFLSWGGRGFSFSNWGLKGPSGWFNNSGEFAIQMLIFGSLSTAFIVGLREKWGRWQKWFFYLMPFTAFLTVLGASSRGSQLALLVMGIILLVKSRLGFKVLFFVVLVGVFLYFIFPEEQIRRFTHIGADKSSQTRIAYWEYGIEVMRDNPLLGAGYGNWETYASAHNVGGIIFGRIELPHNIFIEAGSELGFTGLFSFLLLVVYVFIINRRTRKLALQLDNKLFYFLSYGLDFGLLGYLVAGFFVTVLYYPFFWVQMAMAVALNNVTKKNAMLNTRVGEDKVNKFVAQSAT